MFRKKIFILPVIVFTLALNIYAEGSRKIAVADFMALNVGLANAAEAAQQIRSELRLNKSLEVIDLTKMNRILLDMSLSEARPTTVEGALRIGEALEADLVVAGSVMRLGGRTYINLKYVDVNSEEMVMELSDSYSDRSGLAEAAERLAGKIEGVKITSDRKTKKSYEKDTSEKSLTRSAAERGALSADLNSRFYGNRLGGNTGQSYLEEGNYLYNELDVGYIRDLGKNVNFEFGGILRHTDDRQMDRDEFSVKKIFFTFSGDSGPEAFNWQTRFGDNFTRLSQYTLSSSLYGFSGGAEKSGFSLKAAAGRTDEAEKDISLARYLYGAGIKQKLFGDTFIEANYSATFDDESEDYIENVDENVNNSVADIALESRIMRSVNLNLRGAQSSYRDKISETDENDWALNGGLSYRARIMRLSADYEIVNPDFYSVSGWAYRDREKYRYRGVFYPADFLTLSGGYETYHDNLADDDSVNTTRVSQPKAAIDITPGAGTYFSVSGRKRNSVSKSSAGVVQSDRDMQSLDINLNQKLFKIFNIRLGYVLTEYINNQTDGLDSQNYYYDANIRAEAALGKGVNISPYAGYRISIDKEEASPGKEDRTDTITPGVNVNISNKLTIDSRLNIINNDRKMTETKNSYSSLSVSARYNIDSSGKYAVIASYDSLVYDDIKNPYGSDNDYTQDRFSVGVNLKY